MRFAAACTLLTLAAACGAPGPLAGVGEVPAFAGAVRVESAEPSSALREELEALLRERDLPALGASGEVAGQRARLTAGVEADGLVLHAEFSVVEPDGEYWRVARNASGSGEDVFRVVVDLAHSLPHEELVYLFEP